MNGWVHDRWRQTGLQRQLVLGESMLKQVKHDVSNTGLFAHSEHGAYVISVPRIAIMGNNLFPVEPPQPGMTRDYLHATKYATPVLLAGDLVYGSLEYRRCRELSRYVWAWAWVWWACTRVRV